MGEVDKADRLLTDTQRRASEGAAKEIARLRGYVMGNSFGLRDYQLEIDGDGLRGLGTIEGNVDKLIANRMKKRGMRWTIKGVQRMSRLINLREMGKLHAWITSKDRTGSSRQSNIGISKDKPILNKDIGAWLEVGLPALHEPHQSRPWAQLLRALARRTLEV
ncbi:MAG: UPF0236 family protein [Candidatus Bathyarchaeia archaeon]